MTTGFIRVLKRREVITLSFGAMIGWSWVLLTGDWLTMAGTIGTLAAFVIGGTAVIFIGLTYAELAAAMPKAGGEHVYTKRAFGINGSFVCTWALMLGYLSVPMFESVALPVAAEYLFPNMKTGFLWRVGNSDVYASFVAVGMASAALMTVINVLGIRTAAFIQVIVTALFFVIGLFFLTGAFVNGSAANTEPLVVGGISGMLGVLIMVPTLLVGFDVIPQSAEEINLPFQEIGKWLVVSVGLAVLWYLVVSLGVALALPPGARESSTMATADATAAAWGGQWAGNLLVIGGIGGILTSWNAFIVGGSRVLYALARSGMLPPAFAELHPRFHTPHWAILFIGVLSAISPFFGRTILIWLIDAGSFAIVIAYGMVAAAFLVLRANEPDMPRPFRVRNGNAIGWTALVLALGLFTLYLPWSPAALVWPYEWAIVLGWAVIGALLYRLARTRSAEKH
ncbi:MAG: amino acid permease [Gammaproteobacteria bacterium]|nr:amino acid permease [Gammaproteobacteria bacterium]